jgi:hypothetical protein
VYAAIATRAAESESTSSQLEPDHEPIGERTRERHRLVDARDLRAAHVVAQAEAQAIRPEPADGGLEARGRLVVDVVEQLQQRRVRRRVLVLAIGPPAAGVHDRAGPVRDDRGRVVGRVRLGRRGGRRGRRLRVVRRKDVGEERGVVVAALAALEAEGHFAVREDAVDVHRLRVLRAAVVRLAFHFCFFDAEVAQLRGGVHHGAAFFGAGADALCFYDALARGTAATIDVAGARACASGRRDPPSSGISKVQNASATSFY